MPYIKNRLRMLRDEKGLKQTTVADALGLSRTTLSNYEKGMMPSIDNAIALAGYYQVSLDYVVGLSAERRPGAGAIATAFTTLNGLVGDVSPTASDVAALIDAAILYQCSGAPCGEQPIIAWRDFMRRLTDCLTAAAKDDSAALIDAANAATLSVLEVAKMPTMYFKNKKGE